jgi:integral membrane protein (TIGR01906 family)
VKLPFAHLLSAALVVVATPFTVVAIAVMLFLNPVWVGFDQSRSDVTGLTGYTTIQVHQVTGSILSDLVFGPPDFGVTVNGAPVLDARSRSHMADVRSVLLGLGLVALFAAAILVVVGLVSRGASWFWRAAQLGAKVTVVGVVIVGLAFAVFFEQAFELFHEIFFPPGTYLFDPRTEKLVQLFPDQFWSETSVALAGAVLVLAVVVVVGTGRLVRRPVATARETAAAPPASPPAAVESGGSL